MSPVDDQRQRLQEVMANIKNDPFVQHLEKEAAAGRHYGDSPEFLKAMQEGRMRPFPGARPGETSIDGIAPPPMDWDALIKSIPPNAYMMEAKMSPNMREAQQDRTRNAPRRPPPPQDLRGEVFTDTPMPTPQETALKLFYGSGQEPNGQQGPRIPAELLMQDQPFAVQDALRPMVDTTMSISNPYDPSIERALGPRTDAREAQWQKARDFYLNLPRAQPNAPMPPPRPGFPTDAAEMRPNSVLGTDEPMLQQPGFVPGGTVPSPGPGNAGAMNWLMRLFGG